jgi:endonuclease/exonuclease/phosphatase family metal-dependent hydrolase
VAVELRVGSFNLNNLFGRWNFSGALTAIDQGFDEVEANYVFSDPENYRLRLSPDGRLVLPKPIEARRLLAERIMRSELDVLAVQEAENLETLRRFNTDDLDGHFRYATLIDGNDARFIDVGVLSRYPLGLVTSWRHAVHPLDPATPVFGRDCLQAEIWSVRRGRRLLTIFVGHLKSHFIPFTVDPESRPVQEDRDNEKRRREAETIHRIVDGQTRPNSRFVVCGDFNDPTDSEFLAPLVAGPLGLVDGLADPEETPGGKPEQPGEEPASARWTHRFRPPGQPPRHELFDQIWLSPSLGGGQTASVIDRRRFSVLGDGSDHDLAWVGIEV